MFARAQVGDFEGAAPRAKGIPLRNAKMGTHVHSIGFYPVDMP